MRRIGPGYHGDHQWLAEMASDHAIQSENAAIAREFAPAENDGLTT
jgi:hypothetical protein